MSDRITSLLRRQSFVGGWKFCGRYDRLRLVLVLCAGVSVLVFGVALEAGWLDSAP